LIPKQPAAGRQLLMERTRGIVLLILRKSFKQQVFFYCKFSNMGVKISDKIQKVAGILKEFGRFPQFSFKRTAKTTKC
jgi:hypothetical protein